MTINNSANVGAPLPTRPPAQQAGTKPVIPKRAEPVYLNESELTARYKIPASWFRKMRKQKKGPPYIQAGDKVIYSVKHVDKWFNKLLITPKKKI